MNRKYKAVIFDVDGTLVDDTIFIWETLHTTFGSDRETVKKFMEMYLNKKIKYSTWFENDIKMLISGGATKDKIQEVLGRMQLIKGTIPTLSKLKEHGLKLFIVSGSLNIVIDHFFKDYDFFDEVFINKIYFDEKGFINRWEPTPFDMDNKAEGLFFISKKYAIKPEEIVFVGDNFNDLSIMSVAGLPIAFNSKSDELNKIAKIVILEKNLTLILPFILN